MSVSQEEQKVDELIDDIVSTVGAEASYQAPHYSFDAHVGELGQRVESAIANLREYIAGLRAENEKARADKMVYCNALAAVGRAMGCSVDRVVEKVEQMRMDNDDLRMTCAKLRAGLDAVVVERDAEIERLKVDGELWDFVESECLTVECYDSRNIDDAQELWRVIEYHMTEPKQRTIGYGKTPRKAVSDATRKERTT